MTIGQRLKQFALAGHGTMENFARATRWRWHKLYPVVADKEPPSVELLSHLAALGCNINWLLTGVGAMRVNEPDLPNMNDVTQNETSDRSPRLWREKGDVELLDISALSPSAIRSLNINIKSASKKAH